MLLLGFLGILVLFFRLLCIFQIFCNRHEVLVGTKTVLPYKLHRIVESLENKESFQICLHNFNPTRRYKCVPGPHRHRDSACCLSCRLSTLAPARAPFWRILVVKSVLVGPGLWKAAACAEEPSLPWQALLWHQGWASQDWKMGSECCGSTPGGFRE